MDLLQRKSLSDRIFVGPSRINDCSHHCPALSSFSRVLHTAWAARSDFRPPGASGSPASTSGGNNQDEIWAKSFPSYMQRSSESLKDAKFPCSDPVVRMQDGSKGKWEREIEIWKSIRRAPIPHARDVSHTRRRVTDAWQDHPFDACPCKCREEAERDASSEPLLSSFLHSSILAHDSFERALAFVLANRLATPTMLPTQLFEIFHGVLASDDDVRCGALADLEACQERVRHTSACIFLQGRIRGGK